MSRYILKLREQFCDAVLSGDKRFEVRLEDDKCFQKGDVIQFLSLNKYGTFCCHEVGTRFYEITYVLHGYGIKEGWCVFGFKEIPKPKKVQE